VINETRESVFINMGFHVDIRC